MNEAEALEKEQRARLANERLMSAYKAVSKKERIDYNAWLERERKREAQKQAKQARIEAYKDRKSEEKKRPSMPKA